MEASDSRCTHLVIEDSVTELPSGLLDQSRCQVVRQEVCKYFLFKSELFPSSSS